MQRIGITGVGNISGIYLENLTGMFGKQVKVTAITDIIFERAEKTASTYGLKVFNSIAEMVNDPNVDIVLNITPPKNHFETAMAAVNAGKHVFIEKPLCSKREDAQQLLKTAAEKSVRVGGAPDTFLGAGIQTCRKLIDGGFIGKPVAATAVMMGQGPESWHPNPEIFYIDGGGPMFDMGPYYITTMVNLLGQVERVSGSAKIISPTRTITNNQRYGEIINVKVPTHIAGVLDFSCGAVGTIVTSFDVHSHSLPFIEIYGTEGTLKIPDPNFFGGQVFARRFDDNDWKEIPLIKGYSGNARGLGITEMAEAIDEGRPHRASSELAFHVLDIMHGIHDASASGKYVMLESKCKQPDAYY
jgi:predicted dehydrogenase